MLPPAHLTAHPLALRKLILPGSLAVLANLVAIGLLLAPFPSDTTAFQVTLDEPAPQDILAPSPLVYQSETLTAAAQAEAAAAIAPVYDPPDTRVARQQVLLLRDILDFINAVRADSLASFEQQQADLAAIRDLPLSPDLTSQILSFDDPHWLEAQAEALTVLEQVMRQAVRADQVEAARRATPAQVSLELSETQAEIVSALVARLIVPNSFYNEAATQTAREAARKSIAPVYRQIAAGQAIVVRGQVVTALDLESLHAYGLLQVEEQWQKPVTASLAVITLSAILIFYIYRLQPALRTNTRYALLLSLLGNSFLLIARLMVPGHTLLPFLYPSAALAMLLTVVAGPNLAILFSLALAAITGYISDGQLPIVAYTAAGAIVSALALGRAERVNQFFWAGMAGAGANVIVVVGLWIATPTRDTLGLVQLLSASLFTGAFSASLTLVGFFILGGVFDITTSLQLIELARPDHPLLQHLLRNAPGTYQHSLQVSNLAEQAAEAIGANAMLTRVGALYHDIGKAQQPQYFVENQFSGTPNIHDTLDPYSSADKILDHIHQGLRLARQYRLPTQVRAFISEHHGTLKTMYQYNRALKAAEADSVPVEAARFRYPGPRPQSKETALLMLADGCEAKTRADRPQTEEDLDRIVRSVIDDRQAKGQLDDTDLTLHDLRLIRQSFVNTLKGVFHPRLTYPEEKTPVPPPAA